MNKDLDKALCEKYPAIFANRHGDMRTTAMCWGFECGDGWYQIIDALCACMQNYYDGNAEWQKKQGNELFQPVATQVKEKFGTLRFYYDGGNDYTEGMVWLAEQLSAQTCEKCGQPGETRGGSWLATLCDECAKE